MALTLYQFAYSPYAAKVRMCLALKKLPYETVEVPYMDRQEVVRLTGQPVVPILTDGDLAIADSPRITSHLDERYAPSLRPAPLAAAAIVFETWADSTFEDVAFRIATPIVETKIAALNGGREDARAMYRFIKERKFGAGCVEAWADSSAELTRRLRELARPLVRALESAPYMLGDAPTLADAAVWGNLYLLEWAIPGWVEREMPDLASWYARLASVSGVRR